VLEKARAGFVFAEWVKTGTPDGRSGTTISLGRTVFGKVAELPVMGCIRNWFVNDQT
jgi:hypothetical protein